MPVLGGRFGRKEQICPAALSCSLLRSSSNPRGLTHGHSGAPAVNGVFPSPDAVLRSRGVLLGSPLQKEGEEGEWGVVRVVSR